jgi:hypothetical protein
MTKEELNDIIGGNKVTANHIAASKIANITPYAHVNLEIDSSTLDYYYSINVEELLDSEITESVLKEMAEEGWAFDENKDNIIIFLTT